MNQLLLSIASFSSGLVIGGCLVWLVARARILAEAQLSDKFKAMASEVLRLNNESFLQLAESRLKQSEQAAAATLDKKSTALDEMVKPVKESLQKMDAQLQALEVKREGAYRELMESVKLSNEAQNILRLETGQLLQALRTPTSRGQWGEMQLRRILEMTGMSEYAKDFSSQQSFAGDAGNLRPDYIINLPSERCIIVDSKVPLTAFMDGTQSTDETTRKNCFRQHARQVRDHVKSLSSKAYWEQVEGTPEFVVLFMPGDHFLSVALEHDPELMDYGVAQKVFLTTPITLIALLRTVAYGWRQESLRENVVKIGALGSELYAAVHAMTDHITKLGRQLSGSLESYNNMIGSLERNVLSKARKLKDFGAAKDGKILPDVIEPVNLQPRNLSISDTAIRQNTEDAA
jgi:DNA recombination protein RmuC